MSNKVSFILTVVLTVSLAFVPAASAANVDLTGSLSWDGTYGAYKAPGNGTGDPTWTVPTYAAGNVARGPAVTAIGSGEQGGYYTIAHINDGNYGDWYSWIQTGYAAGGWIGVDFGQTVTINSFAFSRSNTVTVTANRVMGLYTIQYTQDAGPVSDASTWTTLGTVKYNAVARETLQRKQFYVPIVQATGFRILMDPVVAGNCIDELEVYMDTAGLKARLLGPPNGGLETNGWKLAWTDGPGGPFDSYDVYLGRDFNAVSNANNSSGPCGGGIGTFPGDLDGDCHADIYDLYILANGWLATSDLATFANLADNWLQSNPYMGNQTNTEYWYPNLKVGETYYWRTDEHLGSITVKGDVWSSNVIEKWKQTQFLVSLGWSLIGYATNPTAYVQSLANMGLTTLMDSGGYLDLAASNNLNIGLYYDPTGPTIVNQFKNHPATWGYHQYDEPHIANPPLTDQQVAQQHLIVHWADPQKPSYTNLQSINYGITRTQVQSFVDTVHPEILSFDFYQWYWQSKTLIENLEYYRKKALEKNIPLHSWVEVDTDDWFSSETTEARRRRYSVNMNLVYGVKGIWWFDASRIFNQDGTIKNQTYYDDIQVINVQINNLGPYLVGLTSTAVYHANIGGGVKDWTGVTDPMVAIPASNWVQISNSIPIALGMFSGMPGYECIMIANRDITNVRSVDVTFKDAVSSVEAFDAVNNSWSSLTINGTYPNQYVTQSLDQGCGKLLRIVKL